MRIYVKEIPIYAFSELSREAKDKAKCDFLWSECRNWDFSDIVNNEIQMEFPCSDLKIQYSICSCQGDGMNVYGNLDYQDILEKEKVKSNFTEKEIKTLKWYFENVLVNGFTIPYNRNYSYCVCDMENFTDEIYWNAECMSLKNIPYDLLKKFGCVARNYIRDFCNKWYNFGQDFFLEISDEEYQEISDANDWEYLEDGSMF